MKSIVTCDSLIKEERRDEMSTVLLRYPPSSFSFKEALHFLYKACDVKRALILQTERRQRETQEEKREEGRGKGGGGTIRSGRPLMLSICPHLGYDTTHCGILCISTPWNSLYCSLSFVCIPEYRGVCRACIRARSIYNS